MAKDQDETNAKPASVDMAVDRRVVLGGAAAAALTGSMPHVALAQRLTGGELHTDAGVYQNPIFLNTFNNNRYKNPQSVHQQIHDVLFPNNRAGLQWGFYQQQLAPDPNDWGGQYNFDSWPIFRDEMRHDLEKQRPFLKNSENVMDPFHPASPPALNFLDHLDEAIRIALWDRSDIQVIIDVKKAKRRHHGLVTKWNPDPHSGMPPKKFTIQVECPDGGWQGFALWRNPTPTSMPITKLVSTWQVPSPPTNVNGQQIIFLFNGLESVPAPNLAGGILQAVLQWTNAGWFIRSWYVTSDFDPVLHPQLPASNQSVDQAHMTDGRCYSTAISVQPGSSVTGTITGNKDGSGKFRYSCSIVCNGQQANLSIDDVPEMIYAVCAIESYDVNNPTSDYPGYPNPITMSSIDLQVQNSSLPSIAWTPNKKQGKDYEAAPMNNGQRVDFKPT
ncbi:hypothetical protein ACRQ5Q_38385 [Bradyrhizobium sp. PMVTL-01]|uniref:hypothetical protein n=1 Tax=Bradyrhizobium sp. PMVTL-01 TaxID=3434999 RepID=UPI003F71E44A